MYREFSHKFANISWSTFYTLKRNMSKVKNASENPIESLTLNKHGCVPVCHTSSDSEAVLETPVGTIVDKAVPSWTSA